VLQEANKLQVNIRILIVGRPDDVETEEGFEEAHPPPRVVRITPAKTVNDISTVVRARVKRKLPDLSNESHEKIAHSLVEKAGGLFLWASLALDIVCRARREATIFDALSSLPLDTQMKSLYTTILNRISRSCPDEVDKRLAKYLFTWVLCASRPLSVAEIKAATELKFGGLVDFEKTIRDLGGSPCHSHTSHRQRVFCK